MDTRTELHDHLEPTDRASSDTTGNPGSGDAAGDDVSFLSPAAGQTPEIGQRYMASLETAPYGIVVIGPGGRILYFNSTLESMTGYSREEIPDIRTWFEKLYPGPAYRSTILKVHAEIEIGSPNVRIRESVITRKDGEKRWCKFVSNFAPDGNRVVFVIDVTEEKQIRERMRLQAAALKAAANAVVITDGNGNIRWVNPAFTHLTGYAAEEAIGQNPRILKSGKHDKAFYKNLWGTILAGRVWHGEIVNRRKDGTCYTEEMTITPVQDPESHVLHFIAVKQDITLRKEMEEKLRESEERYRSIVEHSHDGILIINDNFTIEYANQTLCQMLDLPCGQVIGQDFRVFVDDDSRSLVTGRYINRMRGGNPPSLYEFAIVTGHARRLTVEASITTLHDSEGRIKQIIAQLRDVTDRKRWEKEMRRRAEEMTSLFETAQAVTTLDMETVVREVASRARKLLNVDDVILFLTEPDGKTLRVVHALHPHASLVLGRRYCFGEGIVGTVALKKRPEIVLDASADPRSLHVPGTPIRHESVIYVPLLERGKVIGVIRAARDRDKPMFQNRELQLLVTLASYVAATISNARLFEETRKEASRLSALNRIIAAAAKEEDLESLLSAAIDHLLNALGLKMGLICGRDVVVTRGLEIDQTFRVPGCVAQMEGLDFPLPLIIGDLEQEDPSSSHFAAIFDMLHDGPVRSAILMPIVPGGLPHSGHVGGILVADSEPHQWSEEEVALVESVGAQLDSTIQRLTLVENLQEALRIKDEVIQNVSHELRTPLSMLIGYTELMKSGTLGELDEQQKKAVEVMNRHAHRLHFMVERLILLGMLEDRDMEKTPLDLNRWMPDVLRGWRRHMQRSGISLEYEATGDIPVVKADPGLLEEVIENLLDNAMKFSPEGGVVRVTLRRAGDEVIISVSDEGVGISQDKLDKVFERFYQVSQGPARRFGGLGIGLALCKEIVEKHRGRIWAESEGADKGATFHIALPIKET